MKMSSRAVHRGLVLALTLGSGGLGCLVSSASLVGCGSDDDNVPPPDASATDASVSDATASDAAFLDARAPSLDGSSDAGDASTGDASTGPAHVLATVGSTLTSYAISNGAVEGTTTFSTAAGAYGVPYNGGTAPFLLEQTASTVARLDTTSPWKIDSSWNVLGSDLVDSGTNSNPYAVVVSAGTKAYVLRYNRNVIDVIDPSQTVDGGAPTGTIDLTPLVQATDPDGIVEMTNGFYDPTSKRLWVVLENIDEVGYVCSTSKATVVAIDTTTDTVVTTQGGSGPGGAYAFTLVDPIAIAFDSANDRLVSAMLGCTNTGSTAVQGAGVEAISLADGTSTVLFPASAFTSGGTEAEELALVGSGDAVVGVYDPGSGMTTGYLLDLTAKMVKSTLPILPGSFVSDGAGHLFGTSDAADGGATADLIEIDVTDGSTRLVAPGVLTDFVHQYASLALW